MIKDKLLTVVIPCYNSAGYMKNAIESALGHEELVEIIIVDDGSTKDNTLEIAKEYEAKYPGAVRAIHQENGGHGAAVMTGVKNAKGRYLKVLDSDDWLDKEGMDKLLSFMTSSVEKGDNLDLIVCNYVYEKPSEGKRKSIGYKNVMPVNKIFTWEDLGKFRLSQYLLMHSVVYKRDVLIESKVELPRKTFYVDNIFVYQPLPYVKSIYYMDIDLYHYFVGREDQSVNEKIMIGRIDQQLRVTDIMTSAHRLNTIKEPALKKYMTHYLSMMMTICSTLLIKEGSEESEEKYNKLWKDIKTKYPEEYAIIKKEFLGWAVETDSKAFKKVIILCYEIARRIYHFN